jgi:hypothetical protein
MAKIGAGGQPERDHTFPDGLSKSGASEAMGTFAAYYLALKEGLEREYPDYMAGYAGTFNSETASMEIKADVFIACNHHTEFSADCSTCGRRPGNNLSLLSGRGDGVYSGVNYWSGREFFEDREPDLLASVYLFDQDIAFAQNLAKSGWSDFETLFIHHSQPFRGLPGAFVGEIVTGPDGFWVGDRTAEPGSANAIIDHWGSQDKTYVVVCFYEPIDVSQMYYSPSSGEPVLDENGALRTPVRPRVVFIVERRFASQAFGQFDDLATINWAEQAPLWMNMIVASHAGGNNALVVLSNGGLFWKDVHLSFSNSNGDNFLSRRYRLQALSFYLHGALSGNEDCMAEAARLLRQPLSGNVTVGEISAALRRRGQKYGAKATELLDLLHEP